MADKNHAGAFDCIRLLAAAMVIWGHSYALLGNSAAEPLERLTHDGIGIAAVAVYMFFAISGYLVTQSWQRDPSFLHFMIKRALRIIPGLALVITLCFAVVGPLVTTLPFTDYFARSDAWMYLSKILIYPTQYGLPGVFADNPYPNVVNGSLWSLRPEFALYVVVALLGVFGALHWRWVSPVIVVFCLIAEWLLSHSRMLDALPFHSQLVVFTSNAVPFFIGVITAQSTASKKFWCAAAVVATVLILATLDTLAFKTCTLISLPIITLAIVRYGRCDLSRFGDYSYGLYLWGFVMQQIVVHYMPAIPPIVSTVLAGMAAFVMAVISWHAIEKRALRHKPKRALN